MAKKNRWVIVLGALIVQLCLGAIYSWSVFVAPLKETYQYTTTQTQMIFSLGLASFAVAMIFAGRWQDRAGPRRVATAGGIVLGAGYVIASFSGGSFIPLALSVGLIGGAGIGLGYVCPIAACVKWFPDKRGLVTGLAVAGFGAGSFVFAKLATWLISEYSLMSAFRVLGVVFLAAVVIGAQLLRNPDGCYIPKGWKPPSKDYAKECDAESYGWRQMVRTRQFWMLWTMFVFSAGAGLMVIGILAPFGAKEFVASNIVAPAQGETVQKAALRMAASAVGILALFNGLGRIVWGLLSDRFGRSKAMATMFGLQGLMMFLLSGMGSSELRLSAAAAWVGFNFGGNFALFPSATADYFGTKNLGVNYGFVFTSYGIAGILGPLLGGMVFDATGSYLWAFAPSGALCLVAAALALGIRRPSR